MYKNFANGTYVLHRLYKDGKRFDLEEKYDIAKKEPKITKELSDKLEKYLKDYDAKLPYKSIANTKDASEKKNIAAIPMIINDSFDANSRKVSIQIEKGKSNVIESYALVKISDEVKGNKKGKKRKVKSTYIKVPVEVGSNQLNYTFNVPTEASEYGIILIDENRFMVKGKFHELTSSDTPKKEKKRKKVKKQQ